MKKWQIAGYLIESKKCVDSLMFIDEYIDSLKNLDLYNLMEEKVQKLYINLRAIYDKCLNNSEKTELKDKDKIYTETFYHRDKKYAHKDDNYQKKEYKSRSELIEDLKEKLYIALRFVEINYQKRLHWILFRTIKTYID